MSASLPKQWLDRATEDLSVAHLVLKDAHYSHACFLAQQCVEKALKAYLLDKAGRYPRAHKLADLLTECETLDSGFSAFRTNCIVIDQYYIPTRYPDGIPGGLPGGLPSNVEAQEAVTAAKDILQFVTACIP